MIIKKEQITTEVKSNFEVKQVQMGIDTKNIHKLLDMLSNIYTNPASFIREWVSNAWDAHVKADKRNTPVVFRMLEEKIEVEDYGTGMGPDVVSNIVANFAASTKDDDPDQIGAYGIGINSGFAWKDSFELQDFYNGTKYHYLFSKDTAGYKIILLYEQKTDRENGCIFSIEMQYWEQDKYTEEIKKLLYFDNVVFEGRDADYFNNYKVFRYKNFVTSTVESNASELFILLNQVKYKLDWDQLGINRIVFPIGVIIPQNTHVIPTPTREGIYYTPEAVQFIKDRIKVVEDDLKSMYNKVISTPLEIQDYIKSEYGKLQLNEYISLDLKLLVTGLADYKLKGLEFFSRLHSSTAVDMLFIPIKVTYNLDGHKATHTYRSIQSIIFKDNFNVFVSSKKKLSSAKNTFIRRKNKDYTNYLAYSYTNLKLWRSNGYYGILGLKYIPREKWRDCIIKYQKFINYLVTTYLYDYDNLKIPKTKKTISSDLVGRLFIGWAKTEIIYNFLSTYKHYKIIYSSDRELLQNWFPVYGQQSNIAMIHVSKKNEQMLDELSNDNIVNIANKSLLLKYYSRGIASILAYKLFKDYTIIKRDNDIHSLVKSLNPHVAEDIEAVIGILSKVVYSSRDGFIDSVLVDAIARNRLDPTIMEIVDRLKKVIPNFEQLKYINYGRYWHHDMKVEAQDVAEKVLRYDQIKERKRLLPYKKS